MESAVVVGAGLAGLACAQLLRRRGVDVTVLEARSRSGGRVLTDRSLAAPVDLGASWIHGSQENPLTGLSEEMRVATRAVDRDNILLFSELGKVVPSPLKEFWAQLDKARGSLEKDCSVAELLESADVHSRHHQC